MSALLTSEATLATRPHIARGLDCLLSDRRLLAIEIEAIDAELALRGVRVLAAVPKTREVRAKIISAIGACGKLNVSGIVARSGQSKASACQMLHLMVKAGEIVRVARGVYSLPKGTR